MASEKSLEIVRQAESIYARRLQAILEPEHTGDFVAIEPQSGDHFLGATLSAAIAAARRAHPDRIAYVMRIGDRAAVHLGAG